jgi:hypothetical protein
MTDERRPGPDVGAAKTEHLVMMMTGMLLMARNRQELWAMQDAFVALSADIWDWDEGQFRFEITQCRQTMEASRGRMTFWFTPMGLEFDFKVPER